MKTRLITSLTMGIEVLSAMLGIPLPLWLAFSGFAYFPPVFLVQIIICLPFIVNLYAWGNALLPSGYWFMHGILFAIITCGIMAFGVTYWTIGKMFRHYLERYSPWLRTAIRT